MMLICLNQWFSNWGEGDSPLLGHSGVFVGVGGGGGGGVLTWSHVFSMVYTCFFANVLSV